MTKYKINIVMGYRDDQKFSISANEAHKAYYLFNNPEKRGTFSNGLAIVGKDIMRIEPDYNGTMGWNNTHKPDEHDWNELRSMGVVRKLEGIMNGARKVATQSKDDMNLLGLPLSKILPKFEEIGNPVQTKQLADKFSNF